MILLMVAPASATACDVSQHVQAIEVRSRVLIIGELHGTNETPHMVKELACKMAKLKWPVVIGLEVSEDVQAALNDYMSSLGTSDDQRRLTASGFGDSQDGRGSQAIFGLIEAARVMRNQGADVRVAAFDIHPSKLTHLSSGAAQVQRDLAMAHNIEYLARYYPNSVLINLVGMIHAKRATGTSWDPAYQPMAYLLARTLGVQTIGVGAKAASHWGCRMEARGGLRCRQYELENGYGEPGEPGVDEWLILEKFSASPPQRGV